MGDAGIVWIDADRRGSHGCDHADGPVVLEGRQETVCFVFCPVWAVFPDGNICRIPGPADILWETTGGEPSCQRDGRRGQALSWPCPCQCHFVPSFYLDPVTASPYPQGRVGTMSAYRIEFAGSRTAGTAYLCQAGLFFPGLLLWEILSWSRCHTHAWHGSAISCLSIPAAGGSSLSSPAGSDPDPDSEEL